MLQFLVSWSIHNRVVVTALALLLLVVGVYAAGHAKLDVFPEFAPPQVIIQTEAPGLSPAEVEQQVTTPIEAEVNGLPGLAVLRSKSIQGLSVVTVIFQDGTDIYRARQLVGEKMAELAGQLPAGVKPPRLAPLTPTSGRLLTVGLTSEKLSPMELRDLAQWTLRPRLLAVPGVAQVTLFGGEVRQYQVQVLPVHLTAHQLTLTDMLEATRQASGVRGAGFLENANQRVNLRVEAQVRSAAELGETAIIASGGTPVRLKDVAKVTEGPEPKFGDAAIDGQPGVVLVLSKQFGGDTPQITRRVEEELEKLQPMLEGQGAVLHSALFRQANFIEDAVGNMLHSLVIGAVLVTVVLFLFLLNWRTAFISLTAIPLSLLSAVIVLWAFGVGINTLTLGGLAIAVGEVVDDAIIDVENIYRRLRENARLEQPRSPAAVVLAASLEVRSAVVYATFIVVLVFIPVFFLSGLQGRLFAPLGYAYVLAVLASLGVALTITPALAMFLLSREEARPGGTKDVGLREPPLYRWLQGGYDRIVRTLDGHFALAMVLMVFILVAAGVALVQCGGEFLPELRESHFTIHMRGLPGTSLPESLAAGKRVRQRLLEDPALKDSRGKSLVRSVAQQAGRAELGEDTWGVDYSELEVDLERVGAEQIETVERAMKATLADFGGYAFDVLPFLSERIKETLTGTPAAVAINIFGNDLAKVDQAAEALVREIAQIRGSRDVHAEPQLGVPEMVVRIRHEDAARRGLRKGEILDAIHTAFHGAEVGQVYIDNRVIDLVVVLEPKSRNKPETIANLWLTVPSRGANSKGVAADHGLESSARNGKPGRVQLKQVADVFLSDGRFLVAHEGGVRRQVVMCNVSGRDLDSFVREAKERAKQLALPEGVSYVFTGEEEARQTALREIVVWLLVVLTGIGLLLWQVLESLKRLALMVVGILFALVGGVAAVYLRGGLLDVGAAIGFVTLIGITMRNGIMMITHWQHLHDVETMPVGPELVYWGARERLAPVLMTALVTGLGLLPIALGSGEAGREIEGPMALVILGGLVTSTALNLLLLPMLYRRFGMGQR
jgi:CzcA family heavy metal efflux pump